MTWRPDQIGALAEDGVRIVSVGGSERQLAEAFLDYGPMSAKLAGQRAGFSSNYATMLSRSMLEGGALEPATGGKYVLSPGTRKYLQAKRAHVEQREQERKQEREQRQQENYSRSKWPFE